MDKKEKKRARLGELIDETKNFIRKAKVQQALVHTSLIFEEKLLPKEERKFYKKIFKQILEINQELEGNLKLEYRERTLMLNKMNMHILNLIGKMQKFT